MTQKRAAKPVEASTEEIRGRILPSLQPLDTFSFADWLHLAKARRLLKTLGPHELADRELVVEFRRGLRFAWRCYSENTNDPPETAVFPKEDWDLIDLERAHDLMKDFIKLGVSPDGRPLQTCGGFVDRHEFFKRFPTLAAASTDDTALPRSRPGPKPKGDWYIALGGFLIDAAIDDPKRLRNVDALLDEARLFFQKKNLWAPKDDKQLREKIIEFLRFVRPK